MTLVAGLRLTQSRLMDRLVHGDPAADRGGDLPEILAARIAGEPLHELLAVRRHPVAVRESGHLRSPRDRSDVTPWNLVTRKAPFGRPAQTSCFRSQAYEK